MDAYGATISPLLTMVRTVEEKDLLEKEIEKLLVSLYKIKPGQGFSDTISQNVRKQTADVILQAFGKLKIALSNIESIKTYLTMLKLRLEMMPVLTLKIALVPGETLINEITPVVKELCGKETILDFFVDPAVIAGAVISYKGKIFDASANNQLTTVLSENKQEVLSLLK